MKGKLLYPVTVFGHVYKVLRAKLGDQYAGHCLYEEKLLLVNESIKKPSQYFDESMLHEYLHALFKRMSYEQADIPPQLEEVMIDQIAKGVTENWKLVKR